MRNTRRARLVLTVLLLTAFTLITLDYRSGALSGVKGAASTVFGPIENAVNTVVHPIGSFFTSIGHLSSYKHDNEDLKAQVAHLQEELNLQGVERAQYAEQRRIDHLAGLGQFTIVHAEVTATGNGLGFEWTATINRGRSSGIKPEQTVIDGEGLVGRVKTVGRDSATVILANDPNSVVGVRLAGPKLEIGQLTGGGLQPMTLKLQNGAADIHVGEIVVTLGVNGGKPYVPEVPVGRITKITPANGAVGLTATVRPFVGYTSIDEVAVVVHAPPTIKHDSLLPPSPTPSPTPTPSSSVSSTTSPSTGTSPTNSLTTSPSTSPSSTISPTTSPSP